MLPARSIQQANSPRGGLSAARPAWRAPRPQSWSSALPLDRIPIPPPPIRRSIAPLLRAAVAGPTFHAASVEYVPRLQIDAIPLDIDDAALDLDLDDAPRGAQQLLDSVEPPIRQSRAGWFILFLLPVAVGVVVVSWMRPDLVAAGRAMVAPPAGVAPRPTSIDRFGGVSPQSARTSAAAPPPPSASAQPPLVSVWSLPRVGSPNSPTATFHIPAAPLVPNALHAQAPAVTPTGAAPPPIEIESPAAIAPTPVASAPAPPTAHPLPVAAPARPEPHRFAPGSLEDQIQKAVEAEAKKK